MPVKECVRNCHSSPRGKPIPGKEFMRDDIYYINLQLANCGVLIRYDPKKAATLPVAFLCVFLLVRARCLVWHDPYTYREFLVISAARR